MALITEQPIMTQQQRLSKNVNSNFPVNHDVAVVMGDETYLTLDGNDWQGTSYFTFPMKEVSSQVKFIPHTKLPKKVLLWLTISGKGMSKPLFFRSGLAVKYYKGEDAAFWPDLASAHYSKQSLEEMERLNIDMVPKSANPPNVSQKQQFIVKTEGE